ncbi:MAG: ThuA domain-containing protein [bacterium]
MRKTQILALLVTIGVLQMTLCVNAEAQSRRLLVLTKSSGFEHDVIKREGDRLSLVETVMMNLGARNGFEVVCTKDASLINAENLKNFDSVFFYTTADLTQEGTDKFPPMTEKNRDELLDWIRAGGGFFGSHTVTDTFHGCIPFEEMMGGEFDTHGKQQYTTLKVVDPTFPAMVGLPIEFKMIDEYYINKNVNLLGNMRVLLLLDTKGMEGDKYQIPPYPITWCSNYGKGRVFISSLGHREDVWEAPMFQGMVVKALGWTFGDVPGDASPNYDEAIKK